MAAKKKKSAKKSTSSKKSTKTMSKEARLAAEKAYQRTAYKYPSKSGSVPVVSAEGQRRGRYGDIQSTADYIRDQLDGKPETISSRKPVGVFGKKGKTQVIDKKTGKVHYDRLNTNY